MRATMAMTLASIAVGLAAAALAVAAARGGRSASVVVVRAALVVAAGTFAAMVGVLVALPLGTFGLVHVAYLGLVVSTPIAGVGIAIAWWRARPKPALAAMAALAVVPAFVGIYATHVAPFRIRTDRHRVEVAAQRAPERAVRIAVITDLQTPKVSGYERDAIDRVMDEEPDLILIAGDFHQGTEREFAEALRGYRDLLGQLQAPGGVYAVRGDVDGGDELDRLTVGTDVEILDDEVVETTIGGRAVVLGGTRLTWNSPSAARVYEQLGEAPDEALAILLSHRPDSVLALDEGSRVDLVVAGHTHGGQIALPGIGPLVTLSEVPREVGAGGLHEVAGNTIYVSTGVGLERGLAPQVRLGTRPSIGILEVRAGE